MSAASLGRQAALGDEPAQASFSDLGGDHFSFEPNAPAARIDWALHYAEMGMFVFPGRRTPEGEKLPRVKWGKGRTDRFDPTKDAGRLADFAASNDSRLVAAWWHRWPDAEVAIDTGRSSLIVLDVDRKNGKDGEKALARLLESNGPIPRTLEQTTPSGGRQVLFRSEVLCKSPRDLLAEECGGGLDVRSRGAMVFVPSGDKDRRWSDPQAPLAPAPPWLAAAIDSAGPKSASAAGSSRPGKWAPEDLAEYLDQMDVLEFNGEKQWETLLFAAHHATGGHGKDVFIDWCREDPEYAHDEQTIGTRWDSLDSASPTQPITEGSLYELRKDEGLRSDSYDPDWRPRCDRPEAEFEAVDSVDGEDDRDGGRRRRRFKPYRPEELAALPEPQFLIQDLIAEGELTVVYGPPKAGKTNFILDAALSIASGNEFHGLPVKAAGPVVYVIGEGNARLFYGRMEAWRIARDRDAVPSDLLVISARPDMINKADVEELVSEIPTGTRLIVLDTFSRTMTGDENSAADMAAYVRGCDELRERSGAAVVVIHHEGKDASRGPMGHTKLRAALDTSIRVRRDNSDNVVAEIVDQRNGPADKVMVFRLETVANGPVLVSRHLAPGDENWDQGADTRQATIRKMAVEMANSNKGKLVEWAQQHFRQSTSTARRLIDGAVPTGREKAMLFGGGSLWLEPDPRNPRGPVTIRFEGGIDLS